MSENYADIPQLLCASLIPEISNALFINKDLSQHELRVMMNTIAVHPMTLLTQNYGKQKDR